MNFLIGAASGSGDKSDHYKTAPVPKKWLNKSLKISSDLISLEDHFSHELFEPLRVQIWLDRAYPIGVFSQPLRFHEPFGFFVEVPLL